VAKAFQERLKPPPPKPGDVRLTALTDLFKTLARGESGTTPLPPPKGQHDVSISTSLATVPSDEVGAIRLQGTIDLKLSASYKDSDRALVEFRALYYFLEDERAGAACEIELTGDGLGPPEADGTYRLEIDRSTRTKINVSSADYSADWSGRLMVSAKVVEAVGSTAS
jgi:hypothetical protein